MLLQNYVNLQEQSLFYSEYGFHHRQCNEAELSEVNTSPQFDYETQEAISTTKPNGVAMISHYSPPFQLRDL